MALQTSIVVTTIFEPAWLDGYLRNIERHGHKANVTLHIICDKKTPQTVYAAAHAAQQSGFLIDCPSLDEQDAWLKHIGAAEGFIPWNTDNRRNIGFLRARERGCDVLISIDDDNYCPDDLDFIGAHHVVGSQADRAATTTATGAHWFNACAGLSHDAGTIIYPRGFPYSVRLNKETQAQPQAMGTDTRRVSVNAGLWTDDPDVDAISRLALKPYVSAMHAQPVVMGENVWCPVNTQNTALLADAMPAYYYIRMGYPLKGLSIDRYGDIMSGFFLQKCAYHLDDAVRFGDPVARHTRSPHNLLKDLYHELAGITLLEDLLPWLIEVKLSGSNYLYSDHSLAEAMREKAAEFNGFVWDDGGREFLVETANCMQQWLTLYKQFG